jgi:hypothetical protein
MQSVNFYFHHSHESIKVNFDILLWNIYIWISSFYCNNQPHFTILHHKEWFTSSVHCGTWNTLEIEATYSKHCPSCRTIIFYLDIDCTRHSNNARNINS